jgi:Ca2+-binding EF-hand superfamily protein
MADFLDFAEFRALLTYLRQYFEYWVMFDRIDTSDDRRISFSEFVQALGEATTLYGVRVNDPRAAFTEIDEDGKGMILFDEFANWVISNHLRLEDDPEDGPAAVSLGSTLGGPPGSQDMVRIVDASF